MPERYPYPTDSWSTGKMRKKGDKWLPGEADITEGARALGEQNPLIQSIEQQHQERMKTQGIPEKMKAVLPRSGVGSAEVRELEGLRREKTQHLSRNDQTMMAAAGDSAGREMPFLNKPQDARRDQLRREIEGNFQSKISPDEFGVFKEEMDKWNAMPPEDRKKRRMERQMENDIERAPVGSEHQWNEK